MRLDFNLTEAIAQVRDMCAGNDEDVFLDTLEAATDALELIDALAQSIGDDDVTVVAIKDRESELATRRKRIEARAHSKRMAILSLLKTMDVKKLERPLVTLSVTSGRVKVDVTNPADIPSQLRKPGEPDKTAIKKQIEAGETVPGAELVRGEDSLSMRIK